MPKTERMRSLALVILVALVSPVLSHANAELAGRDPVISLLGKPLVPVPIPEDTRQELEADLSAARRNYEADPSNADAIIWLGRRLAYLGRYSDAIAVFSEGLQGHPEDPRFYRHRGHRYITTRRLEAAIADLERAATLVLGTEDVIEPDGMPNALGIPTSTLQSNIWYHLGLARYLTGDFQAAADAYRAGMEVSRNPDMLVATTYWLYMTLRRLANPDGAAEVLAPISADMGIIENHDYHRLLLFFRSELTEGDLVPGAGDDLASSTVGYGLGNWHLFGGRPAEADRIFRQVLAGGGWAAFGYIAAEAEIAHALNSSSGAVCSFSVNAPSTPASMVPGAPILRIMRGTLSPRSIGAAATANRIESMLY